MCYILFTVVLSFGVYVVVGSLLWFLVFCCRVLVVVVFFLLVIEMHCLLVVSRVCVVGC